MLQGKAEKKRAQIDAVDKLKPIAEQLGCTQAQLALAW
jgi:aryl-alcohol dehydrogenase-like predicted oxidoreductase